MKKSTAFKLLIFIAITLLFSGCSTAPTIKPIIRSQHPAIVSYALSLQGTPYRYGKASPSEGFDCSGFVQHVYKHHGILLPRTAQSMAESSSPVPRSQLHPGDLLFFNTNGKPFSHVGIYVNGDDFIHAPSQRTGRVLVSSLNNRYWRKHFIGARRP